MKLQMVRQPDGSWTPELLCDHCAQPIRDIERAIVIWTDPAGWATGDAGDTVEPILVHMGRCDIDGLCRNATHHAPWYALTEVLAELSTKKPTTKTGRLLAEMRRAQKEGQ